MTEAGPLRAWGPPWHPSPLEADTPEPPRWAANTAWADLWPDAFAMRGKLAREC